MTDAPKFSEGQTVRHIRPATRFNPATHWDDAQEYTIGKCGRKWGALMQRGHQHDRVDIHTGKIDRWEGIVFASRADWEAHVAAQEVKRLDAVMWDAIRRKIDRQWNKPDGVNADAIRQAGTLLGFDMEKVQ